MGRYDIGSHRDWPRSPMRLFHVLIALFVFALPASLSAAEGARRVPLPTDPDQRNTPFGQSFQATIRDPGDLDALLRYAEEAVKVGNFEAAIGALERMLIFNPDLPRVQLELGVLYFRLQSFQAAKSYLERALAHPEVPADIRQQTQTYLDEIARRESPDKFGGSVFTGLRYQSNADAGPNGGISRIFGTDLQLTGSSVAKSDFNWFASGTATWLHELDNPDGDVIETNAGGYVALQSSIHRLNLGLIQLDSGPRLRFGDVSTRPYALINTATLGSASYFSSAGVGVSGSYAVDQAFVLDGAIELQDRRYHATSDSPRLADRNGVVTVGRVAPRYVIDPDQTLGALIEVAYDATRRTYERYTQITLGANYSVAFAAPFAITDQPWNAMAGLSHVWRPYAGADPLIDPQTKRSDQEWSLTAGLQMGITASLSGVLQFQQIWAASNLPNYRYTDSIVTTGISLRF